MRTCKKSRMPSTILVKNCAFETVFCATCTYYPTFRMRYRPFRAFALVVIGRYLFFRNSPILPSVLRSPLCTLSASLPSRQRLSSSTSQPSNNTSLPKILHGFRHASMSSEAICFSSQSVLCSVQETSSHSTPAAGKQSFANFLELLPFHSRFRGPAGKSLRSELDASRESRLKLDSRPKTLTRNGRSFLPATEVPLAPGRNVIPATYGAK